MEIINSQFDSNLNISIKNFLHSNYDQFLGSIAECEDSGLKIIFMNARSIRNKFDELISLITNIVRDVDVVVIVETWITPGEQNFFQIPNYTAFFDCRASGYGGVVIYVKNSFKSIRIGEENMTRFFNFVGVKIISQNQTYFVNAIYNPNQHHINELLEFIERKISNCDQQKTILIGDLNINLLNNSSTTNYYKNLLQSYGFGVINTHPTRNSSSDTLIDHLITNIYDPSEVHTVQCAISDHNIIFTKIGMNIRHSMDREKTFTKRNYDQLRQDIANDQRMRNPEQYDLDFTTFHNTIIHAIEKNTKTTTIKGKQLPIEPWANNSFVNLIKNRNKLLSKSRRHPQNRILKIRLRQIKNEINTMKSDLKSNYYEQELGSNDSKRAWKALKSALHMKTESNDKIVEIRQDEILITDPQSIANTLNDHFIETTATEIGPDRLGISPDQHNDMTISTLDRFESTTPDEIIYVIDNSVKIGKATGYDQISPKIIKEIKHEIAIPLTYLFNKTLSNGIYPDELKIAKIKPLFKTGDSTNCNNYRPIAILPIISKIFETIIKTRICSFLYTNRKLDPYQYGFIQKSSTNAATADFTELIKRKLNKKKLVASVLLDISKAFEKIPHHILLKKIYAIGIRHDALNLLDNFLKNRKQFTEIEGKKSHMKNVSNGVPQGSVISPILFIIFINDIFKLRINGRIFCYADDTTLVNHASSIEELTRLTNGDLDIIVEYFRKNGLKINIEKTRLIIFRNRNKRINSSNKFIMNGKVINESTSVKYLGLWLDPYLTWNNHISHIKNKISPIIGLTYRLKNYLPRKCLKLLYHSFINSHLQYLNMIWGLTSKRNIADLQTLQNRAIKNILGLNRLTSTTDLYNRPRPENFYTVKQQVIAGIITYMNGVLNDTVHTNYNGPIVRPETHYQTRQNTQMYIMRPGNSHGTNCIAFIGYKIYDKLDEDIKNTRNKDKFKKLTLIWIQNSQFFDIFNNHNNSDNPLLIL